MTTAQTAKDQALSALRAGDVAAARAAAERAVALDTAYAEGWAALGTVALVGGDAATAERHLAHALTLKPMMAEVRLNHAVTLGALGRLADALAALEQATTVDPTIQAGGALARLVAQADATHKAAPTVEGGVVLARALMMAGDSAGAEAVVRGCLELAPTDGELWTLLGAVQMRQGKLVEAEATARRAAEVQPDDPTALVNVAGLRLARGDRAGALQQARLAAQTFPDDCRAWTMVADIIDDDDDRGWDALRTAARCPNATAAVQSRAAFAATMRVDWQSWDELSGPLLDNLAQAPANPFRLLVQDIPPATIRRNAEAFCAAHYPLRRPIHRPAEAKGKLRLGYLSPDFGPHPVGTTVVDLFRHHDRNRFEVRAYAIGPDRPSPERQAIRAAVDSFDDLSRLNDVEAARRIRDDGVDILIDLAGHTKHNRLDILAFRPAPVQMHFLGYPSTTGAPFVDYLIGDARTVPDAHLAHFTEAVIRLPHSYLVNSARGTAADGWTRERFGFGRDQVVLCCFNHPHKITRPLFACWAEILHAVPQAVLWLRADHPAAIANLRAAAAGHGLDPNRLHFAPRTGMDVHLARYGVAELMLDTIPYNAHTTAADALWMGCPVLTAPSATFASRVCAGLLAAIGMDELVAADLSDYTARAIRLAQDATARAALRQRLAGARDSVLFDNAAYARRFERGLTQAWERHRAGLAPTAFDVTET